VTPALTALLQDPRRAQEVAPEAVPALLVELAAVQTALAARLLAPNLEGPGNGQPPEGDRLLKVREAAGKLGMTPDYLYHHSKKFPFTVKPTSRMLRFSARGIEKFIRQREGR
jgi:predicted DNA-binding transcriptional regulator AlpA